MKNKLHNKIRGRLREYRKECLECLRPKDDFVWGFEPKNVQNTINLVNKIMRDISVDAWPKTKNKSYVIADNRWRVKLGWLNNKHRLVDLKYRNDDHTAWLVEDSKKAGTYIDFDIGGS
jgi:hypothetical protein